MFQKRNPSINYFDFVREFLEVPGQQGPRNLLQTSQTPPCMYVTDIVSIYLKPGQLTVPKEKPPVETGGV